MEFLILFIIIILIVLICFVLGNSDKSKRKYNYRGFDHNKIHRNGTKYDDNGFDYYGFDAKVIIKMDIIAKAKTAKVNTIGFLIQHPARWKDLIIQKFIPLSYQLMHENGFVKDLG